jgi:PAS domain S-box-containing protein
LPEIDMRERESERSAAVAEATLSSIPEVVLVFDIERLRVIETNRENVWGYSRAELITLDAFALFPRWWVAGKNIAPGHRTVTLLRQKTGPEVLVEIVFSRATITGREVLVASVRNERDLSAIERELEDTNRYLHAIVENIPDMIFVKDATTLAFRRFNRAGEELLGFTRGELLGKTDHDFYPKDQADFFHQKDRETFARREIVDIPQEPIETKLKGERFLHTRKIPIYDDHGEPLYLLGISEDITERIAAERALREYADVVENLRDAVVTFRRDGAIASWNPAAERLYGLRATDAVGTPIERFVREPDAAAFSERISALFAGAEPEVVHVTRVRADGREIDVEETMFAVRHAEGIERIACVAKDLTELERWRRATEVLAQTEATAPASTPAPANVSRAMMEVVATAERVAQDASATVLLLGETGVGKSWLARRIHTESPRKERPFFEINCAGLAPQLLESELFGHEKGAFTGAAGMKRGLVETAEGGTLFLDEVGELSLAVQAQLLTFLDGKAFRRVGGTRVLTADVRLIAATNVDLKSAVAEGTFRRDLFYRLSVVPLRIPPLRERREEIADLARRIVRELGRRSGRASIDLTMDAVDALERYDWPGNIRELRNTLERALILGASGRIDAEDLPVEVRERRPSVRSRVAPETAKPLDEVEREQILRALKQTGGNRTKAAELLGISRSTMKRRLAEMRKAGVDVPPES